MKYRDSYLKTSGCLWQYFIDEPGEVDKAAVTDSKSFKFKAKVTWKTIMLIIQKKLK